MKNVKTLLLNQPKVRIVQNTARERQGSVGEDRGQRDRDAHGTAEVHQGGCEEEV